MYHYYYYYYYYIIKYLVCTLTTAVTPSCQLKIQENKHYYSYTVNMAQWTRSARVRTLGARLFEIQKQKKQKQNFLLNASNVYIF